MFNPQLLNPCSSCFRSLYSRDRANTPYGLAPGLARLGNKQLTLLDRDAAILLYYYNTRRKSVDPALYKQGWSGYTGILQEMLDEVPTRGTGRLERKLSLDVHILIPKFVSGRQRREEMIVIAEDLARQHNCQLTPRKVPGWRRYFYTIFGGFPFINIQKLEDEEKGVGKRDRGYGRANGRKRGEERGRRRAAET
jgi:hypothetical protein